MKFEEIIDSLKADIKYAVDKGWSDKAIQFKINRVNNLIEIYNKQQEQIKANKIWAEEAELKVIENHYINSKYIKKLFLIFELIGIEQDDVTNHLRNTEEWFKQSIKHSTCKYKKLETNTIFKLLMEKEIHNSDYDEWVMLNEVLRPDVVAEVAAGRYISLKKKFGAYNK